MTWEEFEYLTSFNMKLSISRPDDSKIQTLTKVTQPKWMWSILSSFNWDTIWIDNNGIPDKIWNLPNKYIEEKDLQ